MESNEQDELTNKIKTDSQIESRLTAKGGGKLGSGGIEQKGKRTHGHAQQCVDFWGEDGIGGLNGNGNNTIKIKLKNGQKVWIAISPKKIYK